MLSGIFGKKKNLGDLATLFDQTANKAYTVLGAEFVDGILTTSLTWLVEKKRAYRGEAYFEQLEKNAVYLKESAWACSAILALHLNEGQSAYTEDQAVHLMQSSRDLARQSTLAQLNYLRSGCAGCAAHGRHFLWADHKRMRAELARSQYTEELEFTCIYHQALLITSQFFTSNSLQSEGLASAYKQIEVDQLMPVIEQRVAIWTQTWIGLVKFPQIKYDARSGFKLAPAAPQPKELSWHEIWGKQFDRLAQAAGM